MPWYPIESLYSSKSSMIVSAMAFIQISLYVRPVRFLMSNKVMKVLALFSYDVYIWHGVILSMFGQVVRPLIRSDALLYVAGYGAVCLTSFVTFWIIEYPITIFIEKFLYKRCFLRSKRSPNNDDHAEYPVHHDGSEFT